MAARSEDLGLGQNTDTTHSVNLHFHIGVAVGIAQVGKVRSPRGVLGITLDDNGVLVERVCQGQGRLRFLPRVEIVRLLATQPVGEGAPHIWKHISRLPWMTPSGIRRCTY